MSGTSNCHLYRVFLEMLDGVFLLNIILMLFFTKFMTTSFLAVALMSFAEVMIPMFITVISDEYGTRNMSILFPFAKIFASGMNFVVGWFTSVIYDKVAATQPETNQEGICYGYLDASSFLSNLFI